MSILIKGMEMPTSCLRGGCPMGGSSCSLWEEKYWNFPDGPYLRRHPKCPLVPVPPQTNADRIRAMTDEELAEWECDRSCSLCPIDGCDGRMEEGRKKCKQRWLDWLKQEVADDEC